MVKGLLAIACCAVLPAAASDPWKGKKASEWSDKDATRVLTNSPWAKSVSAQMDFGRMGNMGSGGGGMGRRGGGMGGPPPGGMGGPGGGMGAPGGGMGGPGAPGVGGPGGGMGRPEGMEAPKFLIRWESAEPVREAALKTENAEAAKLAELAKEYYVISASGSGMPGRVRDREGDGTRPAPDFGRIVDSIKDATSLRVNGESIVPSKVEAIETAGARTLLFLFPRSAAINPAAKEVVFETSMGPMTFKTKFTLKDMVYGGHPAL